MKIKGIKANKNSLVEGREYDVTDAMGKILIAKGFAKQVGVTTKSEPIVEQDPPEEAPEEVKPVRRKRKTSK